MKQFIFILAIVLLTTFVSWYTMVWMNWVYIGRMEVESIYTYRSFSYIGYLPTFGLLIISLIYGAILSALYTLLTDKKMLKEKLKYFLALSFFIFLFGLIGSLQGIQDYKFVKCSENIVNCLNEEKG